MTNEAIISFNKLRTYCEREEFKGWDPYDGLNSRLFQAVPGLKNSAILRLIMIQTFKRSPINLRKLFFVPKQYNAKGIGLFLSGYCNLYHAVKNNPEAETILGTTNDIKNKIRKLSDLLLDLRSQGDYHGSCWGYNFDWQARRLFLFPKNTPTVVATTFCAKALIAAYEITGNKTYLDTALSAGDFVITDLHRTPFNDGFIFSYSPLKGNDTVFNASLLGASLLSYCYSYTHDEKYMSAAESSVKACCSGQKADGSWVYGMLPVQNWVDSFHTGYNLESLAEYERLTDDTTYHCYLTKGLDYYINNFFEADGTPKYYNDKTYPIDIHCPGQLLVTLSKTGTLSRYSDLAKKTVDWTIQNMQDEDGFFYYQLKKGINTKIPYMRWSNAFMFNALSIYIRETMNNCIWNK